MAVLSHSGYGSVVRQSLADCAHHCSHRRHNLDMPSIPLIERDTATEGSKSAFGLISIILITAVVEVETHQGCVQQQDNPPGACARGAALGEVIH